MRLLNSDGAMISRMFGIPDDAAQVFEIAQENSVGGPIEKSPDTDEWVLLLQLSWEDENANQMLCSFVIPRPSLDKGRFQDCQGRLE